MFPPGCFGLFATIVSFCSKSGQPLGSRVAGQRSMT
jgi:hypothetical protein